MLLSFQSSPVGALVLLSDVNGAFGRKKLVVRVEMRTPIGESEHFHNGEVITQLASPIREHGANDIGVAGEGKSEFGE